MMKSLVPFVLIFSLLLCVFFWLPQETDQSPTSKANTESGEHLYERIAAASEEWGITEFTWEDSDGFTYDWNGDGHPETLDSEFLGAGAQGHSNIVLQDGKSGKDIYSGYAFSDPFYGVFTRKDTTPVIFITVLGNLRAVIDAPLDSIPCPAPSPDALTVSFTCFSYHRLITYRNGSYTDVSGEHPGLLWRLMAEHSFKTNSKYLGADDKDLTEFCLLSLLYYQVRTGVSIPAEWLDAAMSSECKYSVNEILAMMREYNPKRDRLEEFFRLEKQSLPAL